MVKASPIRRSVSSSCNGVADGKVRKPVDAEQEEMQLYLSKLRELVPNMPKDRKVSKVEVINNVIDYINSLQVALLDQLHHQVNNNSLAVVNSNIQDRQPLSSINPLMEKSSVSC